jgi:putative SOS response-associated peptidase YedK
MCGRFAFFTTEKINLRYGVESSLKLEKNYNVAPGINQPVIIKNDKNEISLMKWGLVPFWAKDPVIGYKMINARAEEIEIKPSFRKPIRSQRCLIPANGFYEWQKINPEGKEEKIPFYIHQKNDEIFSMAGIYDYWHDSEGKEITSFAIITTTPNNLMSKIHNRMPVILNKKDENNWLDWQTNLNIVLSLLKPYPENNIEAYPISFSVNNPQNNNSSLINPLGK